MYSPGNAQASGPVPTGAAAVPLCESPKNEVWRRTMHTDDVDAHAICQPGWELKYEQLSAGSFRGSIDHVHLPGMSLLREGANRGVRQFGQMSPHGYGIAVPLAFEGGAFFSGQRLSMLSAMLGPSNELELCSQGPLLMAGVIVDVDLLYSAYCKIYGRSPSGWLNRQIVLQLSEHASERMRRSLQYVFHALAQTPSIMIDATAREQLQDSLLLECLNLLPQDFDCSELKTIEARRKVVARTCSFISSHCAEPLSLLQLCSRVGASERKLNYCFQDVLGMSPGRYLRAARLNGVRRELRNAGDSDLCVQDIAAHWSFWHLSQFSTDYKRQFGELPSETLRYARKRHTQTPAPA